MSGAEAAPPLWGVKLAQLSKRGSQFLNERLRLWGLGTGLHPYLLALADGGLHQEALSQLLWVDKANTARAVAKLEAMGLVERTRDHGDARLKRVELTERGRGLLKPIQAALEAWEAVLREGLSEAEIAALDRFFSFDKGKEAS